jgi:tetratricopeptide (TPR) repeat protein
MQRDQVKFNDILSKTKLRLKSLAAANPNEDVYVLDIERVNLLQGKVQEAIDTLNEHMTESRRAVFESRLARIYAGWAKSEAGQNNGKFTRETFEKIKMSLRYDPNLTEALWMLTLIGTEDSELSNEALALYDPVKNRETAPGEVLREYANYLLKQKRSAEALDWLELAYQRTPTDPIVANNLAFLLLSGAQTDPERALRLANQAIDQAPNLADPKVRGSLYDTKAAALIALTRYAEAIPYLEAALRDRPADKKILVSLRDSYAATGQRQFAERYQRRLDELDAAPAPQQ